LDQVVAVVILLLQAEFQQVARVMLAEQHKVPAIQITAEAVVVAQHSLAATGGKHLQAAAVMVEHLIFLVL
jgi:hypothetical protein